MPTTYFESGFRSKFARSNFWPCRLSIWGQLDALDSVKSRYEPATTSKSLRRFIGGLVMPFAARLVGNLVFDESTTPGKRFICGVGVYLFVKGGLNIYRKHKVRRFQRARKVKSYTGKGYFVSSLIFWLVPYAQFGWYRIYRKQDFVRDVVWLD